MTPMPRDVEAALLCCRTVCENQGPIGSNKPKLIYSWLMAMSTFPNFSYKKIVHQRYNWSCPTVQTLSNVQVDSRHIFFKLEQVLSKCIDGSRKRLRRGHVPSHGVLVRSVVDSPIPRPDVFSYFLWGLFLELYFNVTTHQYALHHCKLWCAAAPMVVNVPTVVSIDFQEMMAGTEYSPHFL